MPKRRPHFRGLKLGPLGSFGVVYDPRRRRFKRRYPRRGSNVHVKHYNLSGALLPNASTAIDDQWDGDGLTRGIVAAAGDENGRLTNEIKCRHVMLKGRLDFGTTTPATRVRLIITNNRAGQTPLSGDTIDTMVMYGRRSEDIRHVYYDRTFTYNGTDRYRQIYLRVPLRNLKVHYSDNTATSQDRHEPYIFSVSDVNASDANFDWHGLISFTE